MIKTRIKIFLFTLWGLVVCLAIYIYFSRQSPISGTAETLRNFIRQSGVWGPLIYVSGYAFRSLIFFPASILTVTAGILFGPWLGILLTLIGENISANISFVVGRYFTADLLKYLNTKKRFVPRLTCKIQDNGFLTVLIMRLMFLPFDLVGYSSGMCSVKQRDFALATVIGTIPGLLTFVFLGGSLLNFRYLILAAVFLTFGLTVSFWLKKTFLIENLNSSTGTD
jgi:uncharacterized membrane protein YdjX (TVP38/TMEM64 family)